MNYLAIVGTNSNVSTNRMLLQFMQRHFKEEARIELYEVRDLPVFYEVKDDQVPEEVAALSAKILQADGVIIATPEYDHAIPAVLKSALEWISYTSQALTDKPVLIVGASHGALGSSRAQAHLRQILDSPELAARLMPSSEFLLGKSQSAFNTSGTLINEEKRAELDEIFREFVLFTQLITKLLSEKTVIKKDKKYVWQTQEA
ncbi:NADPH-dependent FMN reductase [Vibrio gazogenes]|uniref:NAD(P)H-dependent FMN reductase n=2 Tax=Vibrio gazogenes TaxID=687 RepID=A0A1M5HKH8_VIBGA|nr:NADPH-dependent FMN reductase [Vibrio gazogenes]ASA56549.1 NADPH-dependent FMN reductase [Vibrio gazogenes]USP14496.1 NAD(P)H-dependent oxidoreductase [Vibrio gazogenes]SHG16450.1 NAD(P)H-dependent FMN reductase [Vibrio gazogenes DSM 21264] [Vibrio gazogenes DSM 21264 = NBRC 103151]SJN57648.1 NADPH azoreductase [Vibrio gazogenes]